jgi:hypothetical protein
MDFMKLFLRSIALVPGVIQGVESLFGEKSGMQKKAAALEIVGTAIDLANAVTLKHIADSSKFTAGLNQIIDGVVDCMNASVWSKS